MVIQTVDGMTELLKKGWCQGVLARDFKNGTKTPWLRDGTSLPRKWCVIGALNAVTGDLATQSVLLDMMVADLRLEGRHKLAAWNDDPYRKVDDVLHLLGRIRSAYYNAYGRIGYAT